MLNWSHVWTGYRGSQRDPNLRGPTALQWEGRIRARGSVPSVQSDTCHGETEARHPEGTTRKAKPSPSTHVLVLQFLIRPCLLWFLAGGFGDEKSSCHSECPACGQRLHLQPDQAGPGGRNAGATLEHRHSAFTGSHEDFPQPPAGSRHPLSDSSQVSVPRLGKVSFVRSRSF